VYDRERKIDDILQRSASGAHHGKRVIFRVFRQGSDRIIHEMMGL